MNDDYPTGERKFVSVDDAVAEKQRLAAARAPRLWRISGPFLTLNEPVDFVNRPPVQQPGEFFVVFAANAFFAVWFSPPS